MSAAEGYAEGYADNHMPDESWEVEDQATATVGDAVTWLTLWAMVHDAYEAGWDQAMNQARESLR